MGDEHLSRYPQLRARYLKEFEKKGVDSIPLMDPDHQHASFRAVAGALAAVAPDAQDTIVDIGCADGLFLPYVRDLGYRYHGADLMPEYVDRCYEKFPEGHVFRAMDATDAHDVRRLCADLGGVDWATCVNIFGLVKDRPEMYREVLKAWMPVVRKGLVMLFRYVEGKDWHLGVRSYPPDVIAQKASLYGDVRRLVEWPHGSFLTYVLAVERR